MIPVIRTYKRFFFILLFFHILNDGMAQLKLKRVYEPGETAKKYIQVNKKTAADTLSLPFWDDFSGTTGEPDPARWMPGSGVFINKTLASNPPTIGVATFDGATQHGGIYNSDPLAVGKADTLVSLPINLGTLTSDELNGVYLSFYYQYFGVAEMPDQEDSLRLSFLNQQSKWEVIDTFTKDRVHVTDSFIQVIYQLDTRFLHGAFQFKFEVFARLSGPYDSWHVDYVYLDKNRNVNDKSYFDRAIATLPDYIFDNYSAIPVNQFFVNPEKFTGTSSVDIYNLDDFLQPIEYTAKLVNTFDKTRTYQILNLNTEVNPILRGKQRRKIHTGKINAAVLDDQQDSIYLTLQVYISSGDSILDNGINYRLNDSTSFDFVLHNYYATDDGTAENGLGLELKGGKVAYRFVLEEPDVLNRVDIHFPNIGRIQAGSGFSLFVWKDLTGLPQDIIYERENMSVDPIDEFNQFQTIRLPDLFVADTIYIGWEQYTTEFFAVGFDKSHDHGDDIFYNVSDNWEPNTEFQGNLMFRPYFGKALPTSIPDKEESGTVYKIYPNPASGILRIEGPFESMILRDLTGKIVYETVYDPFENRYDISRLKKGVYIITLIGKHQRYTEKLIVSD